MDGKTETRTTLHLSVTREDKRELKIIAAERDTTISALLHEWIERERRGAERRGKSGRYGSDVGGGAAGSKE